MYLSQLCLNLTLVYLLMYNYLPNLIVCLQMPSPYNMLVPVWMCLHLWTGYHFLSLSLYFHRKDIWRMEHFFISWEFLCYISLFHSCYLLKNGLNIGAIILDHSFSMIWQVLASISFRVLMTSNWWVVLALGQGPQTWHHWRLGVTKCMSCWFGQGLKLVISSTRSYIVVRVEPSSVFVVWHHFCFSYFPQIRSECWCTVWTMYQFDREKTRTWFVVVHSSFTIPCICIDSLSLFLWSKKPIWPVSFEFPKW